MMRGRLAALVLCGMTWVYACRGDVIYFGAALDRDDRDEEDGDADTDEVPLACSTDIDCSPANPYCALSLCVECRTDADCSNNERCEPDGECD